MSYIQHHWSNPRTVASFDRAALCDTWRRAAGPMLQTPYYPAFISAAAWSPTRAGVPWSGSWVQLDLRAIEVRSTKSSCWDGFELAKVQYFWA